MAPCALLTIIAVLAVTFGSPATQTTVTNALINVIVVVGMYIFVGNSGIVSFGHLSFMAIAAYVTAWLTMPSGPKQLFFSSFPNSLHFVIATNLNPVLAGLVAAGFAMILALLMAFPIMRLPLFQCGMATLALLVIVNVVISNWDSVTNGSTTIIGVPIEATIYTSLIVALLTVTAAYIYQTSKRGLLLRAAREDGFAARASGIYVHGERWIAFGVSAFFTALGGVMYAYFLPFDASTFYLPLTFLTVAMLIIGGRNSLWGAVVGVVVVSVISEVTRRFEAGMYFGVSLPNGTTEVVVGAAMLLILIFRPSGLTGGREVRWPAEWPRLRRKAAARSSAGTVDGGVVGEAPQPSQFDAAP